MNSNALHFLSEIVTNASLIIRVVADSSSFDQSIITALNSTLLSFKLIKENLIFMSVSPETVRNTLYSPT